MWIIQAIVDVIVVYLLLRLWRDRRSICTTADKEELSRLARGLEEYRGELSDLLDSIEIAGRREREALKATVRAVRNNSNQSCVESREVPQQAGTDMPRPKGVDSLRDSVRELAEQELPRERIASRLGVGIGEVDLLLRLPGSPNIPKVKENPETVGAQTAGSKGPGG
jgi:hypothetical protein